MVGQSGKSGKLTNILNQLFLSVPGALEDHLACKYTVHTAPIHLRPGGRFPDEYGWSSNSAKTCAHKLWILLHF